jgi:hypothetical protein
MEIKEIKQRIIQAGHVAVEELIKVAEEPIINDIRISIEEGEEMSFKEEALAADKLKNAAATKKLAIFDAFEILARLELEQNIIDEKPEEEKKSFSGFAEKRSRNV